MAVAASTRMPSKLTSGDRRALACLASANVCRTAVAYRAAPVKTAYVEPVAVGDELPELPVFLTEEEYILAPLEETYQASWAAFPGELKELFERPAGG